MCGFCNVWMCLCLGVCNVCVCGICNVWLCVSVAFVMCFSVCMDFVMFVCRFGFSNLCFFVCLCVYVWVCIYVGL